MNANFFKSIQEQINKAQQGRDHIEVSGESGAGLVKLIMTGRYDVKSINIDKGLLNEDKEVLENLVAAAVNSAVKKVEKIIAEDMQKMAQESGMKMFEGMKPPF